MNPPIRSSRLFICALFTSGWIAAVNLAQAVPLVTFSFNGSTGSEASFAPDAQPLGAAASSMTRGSGLTANAGAGAFNSRAWTTSTSRDLNDYYSFSITPDAGYSLSLTGLELDEQRSGTGIIRWAIYSSLDSFGTALASFSIPDDTNTRVNQGVTLGSQFLALSGPVEFRIYGFAAESSAGTWRIDNVELSGVATPSSVPDAGSSLALLSLALGSLSLVSRFRRP